MNQRFASYSFVTLSSPNVERINQEYYSFNVQTTGLDPKNDRIVEIGIVHYKNNEILDQFTSLINPGFSIPEKITKINKLDNQILKSAPDEMTVINEVSDYLSNAFTDNVIICAHNVNFHLGFLVETLNRYRVAANILAIDTMEVSKHTIKRIKNYNLNTLATYFNNHRVTAIRAIDKAKICGFVLKQLVDTNVSVVGKRKNQIYQSLSDKELEFCAFIYRICEDSGIPTDLLRFNKDSAGYLLVTYWELSFKVKIGNRKKYILLPKEKAKGFRLPTKKASISEGEHINLRTYFESIKDLYPLKSLIIHYMQVGLSIYSYIRERSNNSYFQYRQQHYYDHGFFLTAAHVDEILNEDEQTSMHLSKLKSLHFKTAFPVDPTHERVPVQNIRNLNDWHIGFADGYPLWQKGEFLRKSGKALESIAFFDQARESGYVAPALYWSYALAYRKLGDYENEIDLLYEASNRLYKVHDRSDYFSKFDVRHEKAIHLFQQSQNFGING